MSPTQWLKKAFGFIECSFEKSNVASTADEFNFCQQQTFNSSSYATPDFQGLETMLARAMMLTQTEVVTENLLQLASYLVRPLCLIRYLIATTFSCNIRQSVKNSPVLEVNLCFCKI
uniref:Uncharacterized protein n=1 Tax=Parascaris univalens TaxID=6257 RepID=A0A915CLH3_PARUN